MAVVRFFTENGDFSKLALRFEHDSSIKVDGQKKVRVVFHVFLKMFCLPKGARYRPVLRRTEQRTLELLRVECVIRFEELPSVHIHEDGGK